MSDETSLHLTLNGTPETWVVAPALTLLEVLRARGHSGTKEGCGDGDCGACTVAVLGQDAEGKPQYQAVNSCLIPVGAVAGCEVITVEGLAGKTLHPVQQALVDAGGSQCGYCTPGFVMSLFAGYYAGHVDDETFEGNLCRCTGYLPIRRAARALGTPKRGDGFVEKLVASREKRVAKRQDSAVGRPGEVFYRPGTLEQLFETWAGEPEAVLIAGGTDLGLELSHKTRDFPVLISLEGVRELQVVVDSADALKLGASVTLSHIERANPGRFPALDEMLRWFAARQIRNRATLGGNLGTASPIGDLPPVLLALDASVKVANRSGERTLPLADFFTGYRQTVLGPQEVIVSVTIPKTLHPGATRRLSASYKVGKRGTDDISIVAAAFTVDLDAEDRVLHARLAYGGVAPKTVRATAVETFLVGKPWTPETVRVAQVMLHETFTPIDDLRGSAAYRRRLAGNLFEKFFVQFAAVPV